MQTEQPTILQGIRAENQAAIRQFIYQFGPVTRMCIAESLSLSLPTITTTVNNLISKSLVCNIENTQTNTNKLGRKSSLVDVNEQSRYFMGIEIRGSFRRFCITDYRGNIVAVKADDSFYPDYDENIRITCRIARQMMDDFGSTGKEIATIGFCMPGLINREKMELDIHPGYNWRKKSVARDARKFLGYDGPIVLENNVCARAYGAYMFHRGLLKPCSSFSYLYVSSGIACPTVHINSHFHETIAGLGEIGHMIMDPEGAQCSCGNRGCLEAYSGERSILTACQTALCNGEAPELAKICPDPTELRMADVLAAQKKCDERVNQIVFDAVSKLGIAVANVDNMIRPDCFLMEGQIFENEENRRLMLNIINKNLYTAIDAKFNFVFMPNDEYSGALGAAAVAVKSHLTSSIL